MALLPKTEEALFNCYAGYDELARGVHELGEVAYRRGRVIGAEEFDPLKHDPGDINYLSLTGILMGKHYVNLTLPRVPIEMRLITYHRQDDSDPRIVDHKRRVTHSLIGELIASRPSAADTVSIYDVGNLTPGATFEDSEEIPTDTTEEAGQILTELCSEGALSFVLGDFADLRFEPGAEIENAVGVIVNDPIDRSVQRQQHKIELRAGGLRGVNLKSRVDVEKFNQMLGAFHQDIEYGMELAGLAVAHAVYNPSTPTYFSADVVDSSISNAISRVIGS